MKYKWAKGFHPPKGVDVELVGEAIDALPEPTPTALFEASKRKRHVLHSHLWAEGDQVWANRARMSECRSIIAHVKQEYTIGGKTIEVRAVEFLRESGENGQWTKMQEIIESDDLHYAYINEIKRLQQQALDKLDTFQTLLKQASN